MFSIYILILTVMPCVDQPEDPCVQQTSLSQTSDDNQTNDFDQCSPFCSCECCVTPVIQQNQLVKLEYFTVLLNCFSDNYASVAPSGYSIAVWQPPQLS